jgi:cytochrome c oxidase subunit II
MTPAGFTVWSAARAMGAGACPVAAVGASPIPSIFRPGSTPADSIYSLALFVLAITGAIFVVVAALLTYSIVKFRRRPDDDGREPPQVYGSNQVELAWTVTPVLIVLILFFAAARVIHAVQEAPEPPGAVEVTVIGHQFWWEYRYPKLGVVTANELHIPVSDREHPTPTFLTLLSADTDHSFWVPQLAGKTDLIPNRINHMWLDPHEPGMYVGQCAQYCGVQHAKMLLRVYVEPRAEFDRWVAEQAKAAQLSESGGEPSARTGDPKESAAGTAAASEAAEGRRIFETTACINCHAISGTVADGRFGPDLTHLMSRETIAAGAAPNTPEELRRWVANPEAIKPGSLMPAMQLTVRELDAVVAYLETLR